MKKVAKPSTVLVPTRWWSVTHNVAQGLIVGEDTSLMDAGRVALALRGVSQGDTLSLVVPLATSTTRPPPAARSSGTPSGPRPCSR